MDPIGVFLGTRPEMITAGITMITVYQDLERRTEEGVSRIFAKDCCMWFGCFFFFNFSRSLTDELSSSQAKDEMPSGIGRERMRLMLIVLNIVSISCSCAIRHV